MSLLQILKDNATDEIACDKFEAYYKLLIEWNEKINLTTICDENEVATKHFLDSALVYKSNAIIKGAKVIDVGTGAGFPGLPLKITHPDIDLTLLDSLAKRIAFLEDVTQKLDFKDVTLIHSRAEDAAKDAKMREQYDVCVSRAVANLATLSELCLPFVKCGGYFVSMKGPKAKEEVENAQRAIKLMGGKLEKIINYDISDTDLNHNLVIIKKISQTPTKYPRKAPKPSKEPLV